MLSQRRIIVVGSSGYLGRVITKKLISNCFIVPTHNNNPFFPNSIRYSFPGDSLSHLVKTNKIDMCIIPAEIEKNQGNHKFVDLDSFKLAVKELIQPLSVIRVVYISSDGIFDGQKGLYSESDSPQPATDYGQRLKIVEDTIRAFCANYCIIRPSYLYGHALGSLDSRLQRTKNLCQSQQQAIYFDDMFKSPLHVMDAANIIISLSLSEYVGVVHIGGPRMSVYAFHNEAIASMEISGQILSTTMPTVAGFLRDTSLDTRLCTSLTGFVPQSISKSFSQYLQK